MQKIKSILAIVLMAIACLIGVEIALSLRQVASAAGETKKLVSDMNSRLDGTMRTVNAVLIQAGLVAARVEDASRDLATVAETQKKYWNDISKSTADLMVNANGTLSTLSELSSSLNSLIKNTDAQINTGQDALIPSATKTIDSVRISLTTVTESAKMLSENSGRVVDDLHDLLANESWKNTLVNIDEATKSAAVTSAEIAEAAKQMPSIAASIEKVAKTSSRYSKISIPVNIILLIRKIFFGD